MKVASILSHTLRIKMESTFLGSQLAELRKNAENADVTLSCQGEVIMAHSQILGMRYVLF